MFRSFAVSALAIISFIPLSGFATQPVDVHPAVYRPASNSHVEYSRVATARRHRRRHATRKTIKRVGIGAGGGAAVGALLGGGKGAAIGALAGGGAGAVYDHHEKSKGR